MTTKKQKQTKVLLVQDVPVELIEKIKSLANEQGRIRKRVYLDALELGYGLLQASHLNDNKKS